MVSLNKPYPVSGDEIKAICNNRHLSCFYNTTGLTKFVKRTLNKRFRKKSKLEIIENIRCYEGE